LKFDLTPTALCSIIQSCSEAKVRLLKLSDLEVFFDEPAVINAQRKVWDKNLPEATEEEIKKQQEDAVARDELDIKRERLIEMGISDPDELEELLESDALDGGEEGTGR